VILTVYRALLTSAVSRVGHRIHTLRKHGLQVLLNNRPEATTALLMQLCTPGDSSKPDGDWIAKVSDFAHLAADRCGFLLLALPS